MNPRVLQLILQSRMMQGLSQEASNIGNWAGDMMRPKPQVPNPPMIESMMNPRIEAMESAMPMGVADSQGMDPEMEMIMQQEAMRKQREKQMYAPQSLR